MPVRRRINATERTGVAFVREVVENSNCVFKEVDRAYDYGHDAFILLVDEERVTPVEFALQIKAGQSFRRKNGYAFSASRAQLNFWAKHPLLTLGVVYDPEEKSGYWVDLQEEGRLQKFSSKTVTIKIPREDWNKFDTEGFREVVLPVLLGEPPRLSLQKAINWAETKNQTTHELGASVLLSRYRTEPDTWRTLLNQFQSRGGDCGFSVFRGLVRIMGHHGTS